MARMIAVAGAATNAPQEVAGYPHTFPVAVSESGRSEAEWRADPLFKAGRFEFVDSRSKAARDAAEQAPATPDANSEPPEAAVDGGES